MLRSTSTIAALALVLLTVPAHADDVCGDVNQSKSVTTSDALLVLRDAVGQPVSLACPSIDGLAICSGDLAACRDDCSSSPEPIYEPVSVCGTAEPGFKFSLGGLDYVVVETDVRLAGTDRVYAIRFPLRTSAGILYHYELFPTCNAPAFCRHSNAALNVCGKNGAVMMQERTRAYHLETGTLHKYQPALPGGWTGAYLVVEDGFEPLWLPVELAPQGLAVTVPTLAAQGWSIVNEHEPAPHVSYEAIRQYLSYVSIRELP